MQTVLYNPQKGRLETVRIEFTDANTTWFEESEGNHEISSITDFDDGLVIRESGNDYPVWIYGVSRASIGHSKNRALELRKSYPQG
jgi:hypothetical protein